MAQNGVRDLLPLGVATFHILLALAGGDRHGYAIGKEVAEQTEGTVTLAPGTLYRILKQMIDDAWIDEIDASGDETERRRTYRLTASGRAVARAESRRLDALVRLARSRNLLPAIAR